MGGISRANNQHTVDTNATKWKSNVDYNVAIENIEIVISKKLQITFLECKIMLNSKKKVIDAKEKKLFKKGNRKRKTEKKPEIFKKTCRWNGYYSNTSLQYAPCNL